MDIFQGQSYVKKYVEICSKLRVKGSQLRGCFPWTKLCKTIWNIYL